MSYTIFCIGNPLLDLQVTGGEKLLEKYGLKANDAISAEEKHAEIYDEIARDYKVTYVAGGAAQNAARGAAYILPPKSVVYTGCVGDDDLAEQLKAANARDGLDDVYYVKKGERTGACAVVITGHHRSLVTTPRAAVKFEQSHLSSPAVAPLINAAKIYYVEGYFLPYGIDSALELGKRALEKGKIFVLNLSAPFIPEIFGAQLEKVLPYVDYLIGNEAEAEAWASANGLPDPKDLPAVAKALAQQPKSNPTRDRIVVFTHGAQPTVAVHSSSPDDIKTYAVNAVKDEEIVDTNGAGDAFVGGFIGALAAEKSLGEAIEVGHTLATMCVMQVGPQYKWPKVKVL